jgi:cytochrome b involved in lipid metabolism
LEGEFPTGEERKRTNEWVPIASEMNLFISGLVMGAPTEKDGSCEGGEQVRRREMKTVTFEEVQKHNTKKDCWLVVEDFVYDVSKFIPYHPGGSILARYAGQDATDAFYAFHGEEPGSPGIKALPRYLVGKLDQPLKLAPHVQDFRALRKQVASEGLMRADFRWFLAIFAFYFSLYITSLLTLWYLPQSIWSTIFSGTFSPSSHSYSILTIVTHLSSFSSCFFHLIRS